MGMVIAMMTVKVVLYSMTYVVAASSSAPLLTNVALNKPAAHDSTWDTRTTADKAVDGNKDTYYLRCQHTTFTGMTHWWLVDLKGFYEIFSVEITNRGDCCHERLADFDVQVFTLNPLNIMSARIHTCYHYPGPMGNGVTELLQCQQPIIGRYVRILLDNTPEPLHVCEVEVMARVPVAVNRMYQSEHGRKAEGDILWEVTSPSVLKCLALCNGEAACSAANIRPSTSTSAAGGAACQLLDYGGIGQNHSIINSPDWNFYSVQDP